MARYIKPLTFLFQTILMKRQSTYSVASARSSVRSHRSEHSQEQRSRSHSPVSRSGSYCRQASQESRRSMTSFRQSSIESSCRSLVSVRQSSLESSRKSNQSIRQSSIESSRRSLGSMKQSSVDIEISYTKTPFRQSSFDLHPPSEKRKVPYRQASCDLYPREEDRLMPIRQISGDGLTGGHKRPHRQLSIDLHSPKRPKPIRQPSMDLGHSPPPSSPKRKSFAQVQVNVERSSRRSSLASLITQKISSHSDKHLKRRLMASQYHSLDLPSIQLADFSDGAQDRSTSPRPSETSPETSSITSSLLVPSTHSLPTPSCDAGSTAVHERYVADGHWLYDLPESLPVLCCINTFHLTH